MYGQFEYVDREPGAAKRFVSGVIRTYFSMLFYGGISGIITYIFRFILGVILEYSFYKEEIVEYAGLALCLVMYPLIVGFKHIENCGYLDCYDKRFDIRSFTARLAWACGAMLVIPFMIAMRINVLVVYVYNLCYYASNGVSTVISEGFFHKYEGTTPMGIVIGTVAVFAVYFAVLIPFYYLGRRHYRQDKDMGVKVKIS